MGNSGIEGEGVWIGEGVGEGGEVSEGLGEGVKVGAGVDVGARDSTKKLTSAMPVAMPMKGMLPVRSV
jgi:hypothetical protein